MSAVIEQPTLSPPEPVPPVVGGSEGEKKPVSVYDEEIMFPAWKVELVQKITAMHDAMRKKEREVEGAAENLKARKAQLAKMESDLKKLCGELTTELAPLFAAAGKAEVEADNQSSFNATTAPGNILLREAYAELLPGTLQSLEDQGIKTIWDVAQYVRDGKQLRDLQGVGEATEEKILQADTDFWTRWNTAGSNHAQV